jgi:hypothetical protein
MATQTQDLLQGQLHFPGEIRRYIMAGNATFTLVSHKSHNRLTYKVKSATKDRGKNWSTGNQDKSVYFVSVLRGPSNESDSDYLYLGILKQQRDGHYDFLTTAKSPSADTPSVGGFKWFWNLLEQGAHVSNQIDFWHEGRCCVCGRKLTVPESVADGIGPECKGKVMEG